MFRILLPIIFLLQGIPVQQGGKVTGVLRDSQGMPLPGVRIAAMSRGGSIEDVTAGVAMAGLAETDDQGRFTLEDIPPGRYSIAAGRLDLQTYYPGTQALADATVLTIAAGETVSGINFVLNATSLGRTPGFPTFTPTITATIPVKVHAENGARLPFSANGRFISIRLEWVSNSVSIPIDGSSFVIPGPVATDFRVMVESLPDEYEVKSIRYGSRVIPQGVFQLTAANFATIRSVPVPVSAVTVPLPPTPPPTATPENVQAYQEALLKYRLLSNSIATAATAVSTVPPASSPSELSITIGEIARTSTTGVRVSGYAGTDRRRVYISGRPGIVFSDGTFEFREVPPGQHLIVSVGGSGPLASVVVVGDQDASRIELTETALLPGDYREPKDPMPAGDLPPGAVVPPVRITGTIVEEMSKTPLTEGEVLLRSGDATRIIRIDEKGRFETFRLLPGTYELRLQIFGHSSVAPSVTVADKDIDLVIETRRLF